MNSAHSDRHMPLRRRRGAAGRAGAGERRALVGILGNALHGVFFLVLGVLALVHFGSIFDLLSGVAFVIAAVSLRQAWMGLRQLRR
jgi:hypothetical protein